ncbi:MAG TPA: Na+/H+ antiporter [Propionibacteriaceae bacterium]|nr:Na+/H+ antiporter [Propionibacteriaceae bacterium]
MTVALTILGLVAMVLAVTALANRIRFSAPLLLMLVGIGLSFLPYIYIPELTSELVLVGFLPPLLYAAAIRTSVIDFRANRRSIAQLSVLLVVVTALGIGLITWLILPVSFPVAFALGAVVAPPDAIAATTIARRVGLPRRLVTILEGESLVNDATAITCLRVAIAAIAGTVTATQASIGFLIAAFGGIAVGLLVALIVIPIRARITQPVFDTAISILVPFAAYLPAEELSIGGFHGSGVISVVMAGLILGHKSPVIQTGQSRLSERVNWATIEFLLENTVFLMIGLQARRIIEANSQSELSALQIAGFCAAVLGGVIVIRLVWVLGTRPLLFHRDRDTGDSTVPWSYALVIGWAGLRGVVTLAAAFLIPEGVPFRETLIFAAMVVTAGTLLLQGLTLPVLVRALGLRGPDARSDALQAATVLQTSSNAAIAHLAEIVGPNDATETVQLLRDRIAARPNAMWEKLGRPGDEETPAEEYRRLRLKTIDIERNEVLKIRASGTVDHDIIEEVLGSFDIEESMLTLATERSDRLENETVATPTVSAGPCGHLDHAPASIAPNGPGICEDCVREGTRTVHLRICLHCGNVGCCNSSVGRHAERHFTLTHHPVMRSFEPGESWRWCYVDERIG